MHKSLHIALLAASFAAASPAGAQESGGVGLSLDSLLNIEVSAAARYGQTTREAAASISVITAADIQAFGWRSLSEALSYVTGFHVTSDLKFRYMGVRGFARPSDYNNRVLVLIDGYVRQGLDSPEASMEEGIGIPLSHVDRIEVARGPGSALYGTSAMLAVINVITRKPERGDDLSIQVEGGSNGYRSAAASAAGRLSPSVDYSVFANVLESPGGDVFFPEFDTPELGSGLLEGADYTEAYALGATVRWGDLHFSGILDSYEHGDPTAPFSSSTRVPGEWHGQSWFGRVGLDRALSPRVRLEASTEWISTDSGLRMTYDGPEGGRATGEYGGMGWRAEAQLVVDVTPTHRTIVGGGWQRSEPDLLVNDTKFGFRSQFGRAATLTSGFIQHEWQAHPSVSVVGGARVDRYSLAGHNASPRAAVLWHPNERTTFKALYGQAFRTPTQTERFIEQPGLLAANPDLGPEDIRTVELVWERRIGSALYFTGTAYDYEMRDLISQGLQEGSSTLTYLNLESVGGRGVSLEMNGRLRAASFFVSTALQRTDLRGSTRDLVNAPTVLLRAGISGRLPGGVQTGITVAADSERATYRGAATVGARLVGLHLRAPVADRFHLTVSARNLLDHRYAHPAGLEHRQVAIPQAGRTLRIGFESRF